MVPNLAMIARIVGVSTATVSMALRQHSRISTATRQRVAAVADSLGYRPDPKMGRLMAQLRNHQKTGFRGTLCALTLSRKSATGYPARVFEGARRRAKELGYQLEWETLASTVESSARQTRSLLHRRVAGLLFLPMDIPLHCERLLPWEQFAVVSASFNPVDPDFHRITPNWFNSIRRVSGALTELGFRRIGFVVGIHFDFLLRHQLLGAIACDAWVGPGTATAPLVYRPVTPRPTPPSVDPRYLELVHSPTFGPQRLPLGYLTDTLPAWFERERPDAIVFETESTLEVGVRCLGRKLRPEVGLALLETAPGSPRAGILQHTDEIGRAAVELLHEKMLNGETGAPRYPSIQLIPGEWNGRPATRSVPPAPARPS